MSAQTPAPQCISHKLLTSYAENQQNPSPPLMEKNQQNFFSIFNCKSISRGAQYVILEIKIIE
jgi:hypothetical protein